MPFFHVDQRLARARCEAILGRVPPPGDPDHESRYDAARIELLQALGECRLVPGATPGGVRWTLYAVLRTGDPEASRRTLTRAIPARGATRWGRAIGASIAIGGLTGLLAWISPWVLAAAVLVGAWLLLRYLLGVIHAGREAVHVGWMERAARRAARAGDTGTVNELYAEARRMIAEDRVPARVGFRLASVLGDAAQATPFPVDLLRELRQLRFVAPEAELTYTHVRDEIERRLQGRVQSLAGGIRRAVRAGETAVPQRSELRELARTAPGITEARAHQAEILRELVRAAMDRDAAVPRDELLDEIEELIARIEAIAGGVSARERSPRELASLLDDIAARSTAAGARERAEALWARIELLPIRTRGRGPGWRPRPLGDLRAAVAANPSSGETRPRGVAAYRQVREAAARGHERRQRHHVAAMRLTAIWARKYGDAALLDELRDDARSLVARGKIPPDTGAELAAVLRDCVPADSFPTTLLDDYGALRALAPDVAAPHFWSIVDAAVLQVETRLDGIARTGGGGSRALIREIAAAFAATATLSRDPEIVERARALAARAAALTSPSP